MRERLKKIESKFALKIENVTRYKKFCSSLKQRLILKKSQGDNILCFKGKKISFILKYNRKKVLSIDQFMNKLVIKINLRNH